MRADSKPGCTLAEIQVLTEPDQPLTGFVVIGLKMDGTHELTADTPDICQIVAVLASVIKDLMMKNEGRLMVDAPD